MHQLDLDIVVLFQLFNTPGTEITPRSNVVAENFQSDRLGHHGFSLLHCVPGWTAIEDHAANLRA